MPLAYQVYHSGFGAAHVTRDVQARGPSGGEGLPLDSPAEASARDDAACQPLPDRMSPPPPVTRANTRTAARMGAVIPAGARALAGAVLNALRQLRHSPMWVGVLVGVATFMAAVCAIGASLEALPAELVLAALGAGLGAIFRWASGSKQKQRRRAAYVGAGVTLATTAVLAAQGVAVGAALGYGAAMGVGAGITAFAFQQLSPLAQVVVVLALSAALLTHAFFYGATTTYAQATFRAWREGVERLPHG